jgi:hypothetical protein
MVWAVWLGSCCCFAPTRFGEVSELKQEYETTRSEHERARKQQSAAISRYTSILQSMFSHLKVRVCNQQAQSCTSH